ncbi:hypothetical protein TKWG_14815 [Advenella kashmirensis WT001]|uniref:Uncharacterized protein n=1 Tax=Advenella kashmirensis (strain DSM 17095 / LMG 22695 / WT001) TaxID=1036672 RepID=I3UDB9_ADVKW|nr:hypothetical protein [Advenella kashmirensis]AFK63007.1 hypothetical protein TKWG_14815 [Advenella kashmirensis WT001]
MKLRNTDSADTTAEQPDPQWEIDGAAMYRAASFAVALPSFMIGTALFMLGFSLSNRTILHIACILYSLSFAGFTSRFIVGRRPGSAHHLTLHASPQPGSVSMRWHDWDCCWFTDAAGTAPARTSAIEHVFESLLFANTAKDANLTFVKLCFGSRLPIMALAHCFWVNSPAIAAAFFLPCVYPPVSI